MGSKTPELTTAQIKMADEVAKLPVSPKLTLEQNFQVIQKANLKEAEALKSALKKNEVVFPRKEFKARIQGMKDTLAESPVLTGDAATTAERIMAKYNKILDNNPSNASGLLQARKELDKWAKTQRAKVFDSNREGAFEIALREIRNTTNDFLEEKATNVAVKDSLKKQSTLFSAMDNIRDKAAAEGINKFSRAINSIKAATGMRGELMQTLTALGLGGVATVALGAPVAIAAGGALTIGLGGKAVLSPKAKKAVGALLTKTDDAIRKAKNAQLVEQLRLDRAAVVEFLEEFDGEPQEEE